MGYKNGDLRWCYEKVDYTSADGYMRDPDDCFGPEPKWVLQQLKNGEWVDVPTILEDE